MGDVQVCGGFIQQHHRRVLRQHHGQPHPLPLPTGQLINAFVAQSRHSGFRHGTFYRHLILVRPPAQNPLVGVATPGNQVVDHNAVRGGGTLGKQPHDASYFLRTHRVNVFPLEQHRPLGRQHPGQRPEQRGFAARIGPHNDREFTGGNGNVEVGNNVGATIANREITCLKGRSCCRSGHSILISHFRHCRPNNHTR